MTGPATLRLSTTPLESSNLIEASAGTGKTYAIAALYVRLIVEKGLPADEILVVTFTVAATAELRDRIRRRLTSAQRAFATGRAEDRFLSELLRVVPDHASALERINEALRVFDRAAIFTIHGFCQRVLQTGAFESGSLFDTELITERDTLVREIIEDYWRRHMYGASILFVDYALQEKFLPAKLKKAVAQGSVVADLKVIPQWDPEETDEIEADLVKHYDLMRSEWAQNREAIDDILRNSEDLKGNIYVKKSMPGLVAAMDDFFTRGTASVLVFEKFAHYTPAKLESSTKKNCTTPTHEFFDLCGEFESARAQLEELFARRLVALKVDLFRYVRTELDSRQRARNIMGFDELLLRTHAALEGQGAGAFAKAVRDKYKAALIDEFQDTDRLQYDIFHRIFADGGLPLFLIGDPKQSIYAFRGADIFAYTRASRDAEHSHTLDYNWRSTKRLIQAVNTLFVSHDKPFLFDDIRFHIAQPADDVVRPPLVEDGCESAPLRFWWTEGSGGETVNKDEARKRIDLAVATEIARLLKLGREGKAKLGDEPLQERHFAVLVRTNRQAAAVRDALSAMGIPGVLYGAGSVFETPDALDFERLLAAFAQPHDERLIRAAAATDLVGVRGHELEALLVDEDRWQTRVLSFREGHERWHRRGFMPMLRAFMAEQGVLARLLQWPDGERRATNLMHLSELAHRAAIEQRMGPAALVAWLVGQRETASDRSELGALAPEEQQLRLESDENTVRILTMHKSKGLEFPVVFCPYLWERRKVDLPYMFHDAAEDHRPTLDFGSDEQAQSAKMANEESLAESLRLAYVSITRAQSRCYVVWGDLNLAETSPLAHLLGMPALSQARLRELEQKSGQAIKVEPLPEPAGQSQPLVEHAAGSLAARTLGHPVQMPWRIASFSSMVSRRNDAAEWADHEELSQEHRPKLQGERGGTIHDFPKGARAGRCWHAIFEHLDYAQSDPAVNARIVESELRHYGFEMAWAPVVGDMAGRVLQQPLRSNGDAFRLCEIGRGARLNELEFYFPLRNVSPGDLRDVFARHRLASAADGWPGRLQELVFDPAQGFMKGFVDLVFRHGDRYYLADWKSNYLGPDAAAYDASTVGRAMADDLYVLQYHIYAVALNEYLTRRVPGYDYDRHFGGVYYLFLRGVVGGDTGVYFDRPDPALIADLRRIMLDVDGVRAS